MDPLSVSASIIGVLGAAAKVSSVLVTFVEKTKNAPDSVQELISEVNSLSAILTHLKVFLLGGANAARSRASLILVDQVFAALSECVVTFSKLEEVLGTFQNEAEWKVFNRVKWALEESSTFRILRRLRSNKMSLMLMLTILQCRSIEEATSATNRLHHLFERSLADKEDIGRRLRSANLGLRKRSSTISRCTGRSSFISTTDPVRFNDNEKPLPSFHLRRFTFEDDLRTSNVYRRLSARHSSESLGTSADRTATSSALSALSLADVSNISLLTIPIYAKDICNHQRYKFGAADESTSLALSIQERLSNDEEDSADSDEHNGDVEEVEDSWPGPQNIKESRRRSTLISKAQNSGRQAKSTSPHSSQRHSGSSPKIWPNSPDSAENTYLDGFFQNASVPISGVDDAGRTYTYGHLPTFLVESGNFLKKHAWDVFHICDRPGSSSKGKAIMFALETPPISCAGFDFSEYSIHDVFAFLTQSWSQFWNHENMRLKYVLHQGLSQYLAIAPAEHTKLVISSYYYMIHHYLPTSDRLSLLYLLDLLATLCSRALWNTVTWLRLAETFAPLIMNSHEERDNMIVFFIRFHQSFVPVEYRKFRFDDGQQFLQLDQGHPERTPLSLNLSKVDPV